MRYVLRVSALILLVSCASTSPSVESSARPDIQRINVTVSNSTDSYVEPVAFFGGVPQRAMGAVAPESSNTFEFLVGPGDFQMGVSFFRSPLVMTPSHEDVRDGDRFELVVDMGRRATLFRQPVARARR